MKLSLTDVEILRFRAIKHVRLEGLGMVTLITGRNNTGKSSVLEALRLLSSYAAPSVINSILRFREEDSGEMEDSARPIDADGLFQASSLFLGFPPFSPKIEPIEITGKNGQSSIRLQIGAGWFSDLREPDGSRRLVPQEQELFGESETTPAMVIEGSSGRRIMPLELLRRSSYRNRLIRSELIDEPSFPCMFVSPYGGERTATLGALWDKIALSDREKDVVEALQIIDPEISAVSMVGGESTRQIRTAIVRASDKVRPVPLRSYGDGLNRLFGIVLSLVNAKDGLLLIDEFENGMHHSIQTDTWRAVFKLSRKLGIQVVATSHSWDAIEAFQKAASENVEEAVLIRLSRKGEDIIPTTFRKDELSIATRDGIEVR